MKLNFATVMLAISMLLPVSAFADGKLSMQVSDWRITGGTAKSESSSSYPDMDLLTVIDPSSSIVGSLEYKTPFCASMFAFAGQAHIAKGGGLNLRGAGAAIAIVDWETRVPYATFQLNVVGQNIIATTPGGETVTGTVYGN